MIKIKLLLVAAFLSLSGHSAVALASSGEAEAIANSILGGRIVTTRAGNTSGARNDRIFYPRPKGIYLKEQFDAAYLYQRANNNVHRSWSYEYVEWLSFNRDHRSSHLHVGSNSEQDIRDSVRDCWHNGVNIMRWRECPHNTRGLELGWGSEFLRTYLKAEIRTTGEVTVKFNVVAMGPESTLAAIDRTRTCQQYGKKAFERSYVRGEAKSLTAYDGYRSSACEIKVKMPDKVNLDHASAPSYLIDSSGKVISKHRCIQQWHQAPASKIVYNLLSGKRHVDHLDGYRPVLTRAINNSDHMRVTITQDAETYMEPQPIPLWVRILTMAVSKVIAPKYPWMPYEIDQIAGRTNSISRC